ncbi:DEAD/DEAH box helicase [Caenispirillum salinarum]|uniref:DEAD/DEAH box helicase n=1 Tax=Caenispirillum salinarum TaxID=859058 RepID=UPI00384AF9C5
MTFSDLGLTPETLRAIEDVGYNEPTPIQEQAIPYVLMCRDVLGIAQTGTGKTAGFTLPMIDILAHGRAKARMPRSLILAPTRELASQVAENFKLYGKYHKLAMALLIGGESFREQEAALDKGVDVLIATPGRLMDLFDRGRILLQDVKILVIDEADRMLDMGFIPDVERIVSFLPKIRQTLFFSATMDAQIRKLADAFLMNPKEIRVSPKTSTAATVKQALVIVDQHDKRRALRELLDKEDVRNAFIFCNRKRDVGVLFRSLTKHGYDAVQLHGDMPQNERTIMLDRFKKGDAKLMVCSDVAARGIDISDVSHVFNFDVPSHSEDYVHRIGRTGRAGKEGHAYTLATPEDAKYVEGIEKLIGNTIPRFEVDSVEKADLDADDGRGRRRAGGKRGGRKSERSEKPRRGEDKQAPEAPVAAEEPRKEEEKAAAAPVPQDVPQEKPERGSETRGGDRRRTERASGRRNGRRRDDHPAWEVEEIAMPRDAVAFGGHTPAFMLVDPEAEGLRIRAEKDRREAEAEKRRAAAEARRADKEAAQAEAEEKAARTAEAEAPAGEEAPAVSTDVTEATAEEPKKRRRTRRPRKSEKPSQPPAAAVDAAVQAVDEVLNGEAEGPKPPETTVEPAGEPVSMETAPDQGTQAEVASDAAEEPVTEPAGEPVSTEPPAEEGAEPKGKTRRTRTTRAKSTPAKPRRTAAKKDAPADAETSEAAASAEEAAEAEAEAPKKKAPARRTAAKKATTARKPAAARTRKKAAPAEDAAETPAAPVEGEAATTATPEPAAEAEAEAPAKPKRTRAKASTTAKKTATRKAPAKKATTTTRSRKKPAADEATASEAENAEASSAND